MLFEISCTLKNFHISYVKIKPPEGAFLVWVPTRTCVGALRVGSFQHEIVYDSIFKGDILYGRDIPESDNLGWNIYRNPEENRKAEF